MKSKLECCILSEALLNNGKTLVLRKAIKEDAKGIIEYLNAVGGESDNLLFGKDEFPLNTQQEAEYIENMSNDLNSLMLVAIIEDKIVSVSQITSPKRKRIAHNSELVISVRKNYWGIGVGSAVMEQLIKFIKEKNTIKTISLGVRDENNNAIKMYEKFGFERVGIHKNYFNIDGNFYDEILMDLSI